jgi:hypothetical protein
MFGELLGFPLVLLQYHDQYGNFTIDGFVRIEEIIPASNPGEPRACIEFRNRLLNQSFAYRN